MSGTGSWRIYLTLLWLVLLKLEAFGDTVQVAVTTSAQVWMPAVAALLGGLMTGILGPLLKDVVIQRWNEQISDQKLKEKIEESYFAPLSATAEKLIWRMSEILIAQRPHFLMLKTHPIDFNQYKRISTLYRIACLLGWIRAINLELSALPRGGFGINSPTFEALLKVQSALADGHGVEERRLRSFCSACGIDLTSLTKDQIASLAATFEVTMYTLAGNELRQNHRYLVNATTLRQEFICRGLLQFLGDKKLPLPTDEPTSELIRARMISCLGYREALIYREWQDAIGDAMIVKDDQSMARQYRIVGFEAFEQMMATGKSNWIEPLRELIEDVDFETIDPTDERSTHIRDLSLAVAEVLIAISIGSKGKLTNAEAVKRANQMRTLMR